MSTETRRRLQDGEVVADSSGRKGIAYYRGLGSWYVVALVCTRNTGTDILDSGRREYIEARWTRVKP